MIPDLHDLLRSRKLISPLALSDLTEKLIILSMYIWALVLFGVCSFNYFESDVRFRLLTNTTSSSGGYQGSLSLVDSFYFIVITFSTVGYGDISPKTAAGKIVIMILIFAGVTILPGLVSDLIASIKAQSSGSGSHYPSKKEKFVVVCGSFHDTDRVIDSIDTILRRDTSNKVNILLFTPSEVSPSLSAYLKQFHLRRRLKLFIGNGTDPYDLARIALRKASAAFILADNRSLNPKLEDEHNTLRALAFDRYAPNTQIYLETLLPLTGALQEEISSETVCIHDYKQMVIGYSALHRGFIAFLINLLRGPHAYSRYDKPWHIPYLDGVDNEIRRKPVHPVFVGYSFTDLALFIFRQFQCIPFAVERYDESSKTNQILLNPGRSYILHATDKILYIVHSGMDEELSSGVVC
jgi:potassium channel subfamily T protein 1